MLDEIYLSITVKEQGESATAHIHPPDGVFRGDDAINAVQYERSRLENALNNGRQIDTPVEREWDRNRQITLAL